ncbi:hypothetical protein QBC33DRAFT_612742 [Phialemonium atrogriseum]|uniref:Aminoglycoside phosphotransferase domain-containing protein n=1 Tax=Phialemonium atrogriseum TaxID=1093897 RepID=A0AAJ0BV47_9PEZI|nr:uncharacterized protein QBC33DRAFT_612742 [Phialemonium atrogriseum]KAK1765054.1 hypothetical protein QBC33DRAFT_612742 [Phialemonium atrogriseum]
MYEGRSKFDNLVWDKNEDAQEGVYKSYFSFATIHKLEALATKMLGKKVTYLRPMHKGSFNFLYRMKVEGLDGYVMFRLLWAHSHQFPDEKTLQETATARMVMRETKIATAEVLCYGLSRNANMGSLAVPGETKPTEGIQLDPAVPEGRLEGYFHGVAVLMLQLFEPQFPRIGSLDEDEHGSISVGRRPITMNMNSGARLANIPRAVYPSQDKTYGTADEWYTELARIHMAQLVFQHNDLVLSVDDCRNRYVARQLFHRLAKSGLLSTFGFADDSWSAQSKTRVSACPAPSTSGSFRLWCDDWGTSNILLNDADEVTAIIDWEFAYIAPTQFILDPPLWLLLDDPEMWKGGIDAWAQCYDACLPIWLRGRVGRRRFWLDYAARKSWAFDTIYWKEGEVATEDLWKTRVNLLDHDQVAAMEPFVEMKLEEPKERIMVQWTDEQVKERMAKVLF